MDGNDVIARAGHEGVALSSHLITKAELSPDIGGNVSEVSGVLEITTEIRIVRAALEKNGVKGKR
jgi:hypothetical protein